MTDEPPTGISGRDPGDQDEFPPVAGVSLQIPLSPQHFHTFLAVVDSGGKLSAAARQIGMSQPGITHQLNELERRLNVRLMDRARGRPAVLTRAGRVFERHARTIVQLHASLYADLEQMQRRLGGHLRIGASPGPGEHWLPPLLCAFHEQFPDLSVELHVADARSIVEQVFNNETELGFVGGRWARAGLQFDPIYQDDFVLIAAPDHPLVGREGLVLGDLAGVDFIAQEPGTGLRLTFEQALADRGVGLSHFTLIGELGNQESVKSAVRAGYGIGCVWRGSVEAELETGSVLVLPVQDFQPDSSFYTVRRSHRRLSRRATALLEFLQQAAEHADRQRRRSVQG